MFRFVYCLLQKIKLSRALPVIEECERYLLPNHSCLTAIGEELFSRGQDCRLLWGKWKTRSCAINFARIIVNSWRSSSLRFFQLLPRNFWLGRPQLLMSGKRNQKRRFFGFIAFQPATGYQYLVSIGYYGYQLSKGQRCRLCNSRVYSCAREQRQMYVEKWGKTHAPISDVFSFCCG